MQIIYGLLWLSIIAAPIVFIGLHVNQKQKKKRQLRLWLASYLFFVFVHLWISSDDDERIEAAESVSYNFISCISDSQSDEEFDSCFEDLGYDAKVYLNEYGEE